MYILPIFNLFMMSMCKVYVKGNQRVIKILKKYVKVDAIFIQCYQSCF